jgi:hypothetical protein
VCDRCCLKHELCTTLRSLGFPGYGYGACCRCTYRSDNVRNALVNDSRFRPCRTAIKCHFLPSEMQPDETFIGRIERGFDFHSYHFSHARLNVAEMTTADLCQKESRLYERERKTPSDATPLEMFATRWPAWATGGEGEEGPQRACDGSTATSENLSGHPYATCGDAGCTEPSPLQAHEVRN